MDEYKEMIKKIKAENRQKLYKIPNDEYLSDEKFDYFLYVTATGYEEYKSTDIIIPDSIVKECAESKEV